MYVKTGSATTERLTSSRIVSMMDVMKGHLRQGHFDMAMEEGLLQAANHLSREVTWFDRVKQYIVPAAMVGIFIAAAASKSQDSDMSGALQALTRIEEERALSLERSRGGGVVGGRWQCPICLEDFVLDAASSTVTAAVTAARANSLASCLGRAWGAMKDCFLRLMGRRGGGGGELKRTDEDGKPRAASSSVLR